MLDYRCCTSFTLRFYCICCTGRMFIKNYKRNERYFINNSLCLWKMFTSCQCAFHKHPFSSSVWSFHTIHGHSRRKCSTDLTATFLHTVKSIDNRYIIYSWYCICAKRAAMSKMLLNISWKSSLLLTSRTSFAPGTSLCSSLQYSITFYSSLTC